MRNNGQENSPHNLQEQVDSMHICPSLIHTFQGGMWGQRAKMQVLAKQTHRDTVVVQDPVLPRHKLEVDEMCSRPQHVIRNHSSDQLVLQTECSNLFAIQSSAGTAMLMHACVTVAQVAHCYRQRRTHRSSHTGILTCIVCMINSG